MIWIIYVWLVLFIIVSPPIIEACAEHQLKWYWRLIVMAITYIGAPIMVLSQAFQSLLELILPEGWDDDDEHRNC